MSISTSNDDTSSPGAFLASRLRDVAGVTEVREALRTDRCDVLVLIDREDDATYDAVFEAEGLLFEHFPGQPFDLRVTSMGDGVSPGDNEPHISRFLRSDLS